MHRDEARRIALVRAVEETVPECIPAERLLEAHAAAGEPAQGPTWIARRASYLVDHSLTAYRDVLDRADLHLSGSWPFVLAAALVGLVSNYLGPTGRIHVVFNPIVILIVWNLAMYGVIAVAAAVYGARPAASAERPAKVRRSDQPAPDDVPPPLVRPGLLERVLLGRVASWFLYARQRVDNRLHHTKDAALVARRFARGSSRFERIIAEGRTRCAESVRKSLAVDMEPLSGAIGDHVWSGLRIALGEFQRPRVF